jgi:hypothetical protein
METSKIIYRKNNLVDDFYFYQKSQKVIFNLPQTFKGE